jgi:hypothetical protein
MLETLAAQEQKFPFTWLNRFEKEMAGSLVVNLLPQAEVGQYQLDFKVLWFDPDGKQITDPGQMPFLWLSKQYFDLFPVKELICSSFEQKKIFNLVFQTSEKLNLRVLNGYVGKFKISAVFQYALSREDYNSGKSELIELIGAKKIVIEASASHVQLNPNDEKDIAGGTKQTVKPTTDNSRAVKNLFESYQKIRLRVKNFEDRKDIAEIDRPSYRLDLESLSANIESEKMLLNPDSLPEDTYQLYREQYNHLSDIVLNLRTADLKFRSSSTGPGQVSDPSNRSSIDDSLRAIIRSRIEPIVHRQVDSLNNLVISQKSIALEISVIMAKAKRSFADNPKVDTLMNNHALIKKAFLNLTINHESSWNTYRIDIGILRPVREIEAFHTLFLKGQSDLQSAIDLFDNGVAAMKSDQVETPWYMSNRFLWTGLLGVLLLVFVSAIWNNRRNRRILKEQLSMIELSSSNGQQGKPVTNGVLVNEVKSEYFTIDYHETIPESVVGKMHYHTSAIKSVYQIVQGALSEKKAGDFGGYLFGNQYKLPGKGAAKSEIFVEKACDSRYLRSSISNDVAARADLVDELDELVRQNRKFRLIGWFTGSVDNTMEIPEGLMRIHRSFFKEKWQIGLMLNPGSEVLQGAAFLRRKSGYLDPLPDPAAFVKWDEIYRFALNPSISLKNDNPGADISKKDYIRIALDNTWGDSVVTGVSFEHSLITDITSAAANQAIPRDTYQVVGYLYGTSAMRPSIDGKTSEYEVYIDRFIELSNELSPRELPGLSLIGWWGQSNVDVMNYLQSAITYHEQTFREACQISCLANPITGELRIFTRKHSLLMNNNTIETEEYSIKTLLSR